MSPPEEPAPVTPPALRLTEPWRTERLVLRPFAEGDLDALYDMQSRPDVARYLYWSPRSRDETAQSLEEKMMRRSIEAEGDILILAVTRLAGGPVIGDLMVCYTSAAHQQAEIGYLFHPDAQGQGLATEAMRLVVERAFAELRLHRVYGRIDARNTASARVLERLGMRHEAHLVENEWVKGEWTDEVVYGVLADEWARARLGGG
jgi:RimJ/RimL family protein N-acetyltransferase